MGIPPEFEKWKRGKDDFAKEADAEKPMMEGEMAKEPKPHHAKKEEIKRGHQFQHGHGRKPNPRGMN